jgi:hypothetical protein
VWNSRDEDAPLEEGDGKLTPLNALTSLLDPSEYSTHKNQLIVAKQLIEHRANVNAVSFPQGSTPLHDACFWGNVTNLDFVELLLDAGADPNARDHLGRTPLMMTTPYAPGAAKFLMNWPTADVNSTTQSGESFLDFVRPSITDFSDEVAIPADILDIVQKQFLLRQWREIEEMLVERAAQQVHGNLLAGLLGVHLCSCASCDLVCRRIVV